MKIEERVASYNSKFPDYPPIFCSKSWIIGMWFCADRRMRKGEIFGKYPLTYLKRIYSLFPDSKNILHLFSGSIRPRRGEITFDINPKFNPTVCGDAREIKKYFIKDQFDLIIADPPYEPKYFKIYKCKPFNKGKVVRDLAYVCRGFLVWLDIRIPNFTNLDWNLIGTIGVLTGMNRVIRVSSLFEKVKDPRKIRDKKKIFYDLRFGEFDFFPKFKKIFKE